MNPDLLTLAVLAGAANWLFRYLPTRLGTGGLPEAGALARFLAATGPAAIATLLVASILPALWPPSQAWVSVAIGLAAVVGLFLATRSVVLATFAGAVTHGVAVFLMA